MLNILSQIFNGKIFLVYSLLVDGNPFSILKKIFAKLLTVGEINLMPTHLLTLVCSEHIDNMLTPQDIYEDDLLGNAYFVTPSSIGQLNYILQLNR